MVVAGGIWHAAGMARFVVRMNTSSEIRRGIVLMIAGSLVVPCLDASAKLLTERHGLSPGEVALARFLLQTAMAFPLVLAFHGASALRLRRPVFNLLRGMLLALATVCFFLALKFMPLADATAIFFVEPILVTLLSALVLKERIGIASGVAVLIGFTGTILVIRPNFLSLGIVAVLPLLTAFLVALYAILNRRLADTGKPLAMHFFSGLGGALLLLPAVLVGNAVDIPELRLAVPAAGAVCGLLAVIGVTATVAHLMFIQAYHDAPASVLAPLGYIEIPSAVLIGLLVFGDFPDPVTLLGIGVIVMSGLVLVTKARQPVAAPQQP